MLAVRVDASAEGVPVLEGPAVAGAIPTRRPWFVPSESTSAPCSRATSAVLIGRAVVDDEDVRVGQPLVQTLQDRGQVLLLVPGGDEDERVCSRAPPLELGPGGVQLQREEREARAAPSDGPEGRREACDAKRDFDPRARSTGG